MRKSSRRKIFYTLVLAFIILTPLILAYSWGYTLDIFQGRIEKTGGIFIKSAARGLTVFLNNQLVKETPFFSGGVLLTGMEAATYLLRVEKADYQPWSKTVEVKPGIVTELRNIILIPQTLSAATSTPRENALILATSTPSYTRLTNKGNLTITVGKSTKVIASSTVAFYELPNEVFFINQNGFLAKFNIETGALDTLGRPGFYLAPRPWQWESNEGMLTILDPSGGLFLSDGSREISPVESGVKNFSYDGHYKKILLQKADSLEILWMKDNPYQPFQRQGTRESILRSDSKILEARWFYGDDAHAVIRTEEGVFLTEIDGRGGRHTVELITEPVEDLATVRDLPRAVFFKKAKRWFKIDL